jgi:uncharacterized membrane protein
MRIDTYMVGGALSVLALLAMPFNSNAMVAEVLFSAVLAGLALIALDSWVNPLLVRFYTWSSARAERKVASRKKAALKEKAA